MVTWAWLRDPRRFALKTRLALDTADVALWSLAPYPGGLFDLAVVSLIPFAIEAGLRLSWRGMAVPAFEMGVTGAVRLVFGRSPLPFTFVLLFVYTAAGVAFRSYDRRLRGQVEDEWSRHRSAEERRAFLAGQNSVAMGASSVFDGIEGVLPLLGPPPTSSALSMVADGWKARLGASTATEAVYLGMALQEWATSHNRQRTGSAPRSLASPRLPPRRHVRGGRVRLQPAVVP